MNQKLFGGNTYFRMKYWSLYLAYFGAYCGTHAAAFGVTCIKQTNLISGSA